MRISGATFVTEVFHPRVLPARDCGQGRRIRAASCAALTEIKQRTNGTKFNEGSSGAMGRAPHGDMLIVVLSNKKNEAEFSMVNGDTG